MDKTKIRTFNFINSIKGGCGKTTFSVFLAKYLHTIGMRNPEREKCLLLDMDLQGTAMQCLFEERIEVEPDKKVKNHKYLNEAVWNGGEIKDYIVNNRITSEIVLDTIFADPNFSEKEKFRISSKTGYSPVVQYNVFKGGLRKLLEKFKDSNPEYRHFIFDMPPNSDGFSGAALECVLSDAYHVRREEDIVNLFFMTGFDSGQVQETMKEVNAWLVNKDNMRYDNLFVVINDNVTRNGERIDELKKIIVQNFMKMFKWKLKEEEYKKIYFLSMGENKLYSTYCMEGEGLNNIVNYLSEEGKNIDEYLPKIPIVKYADAETQFYFKDVTEEWLEEKMKKSKRNK